MGYNEFSYHYDAAEAVMAGVGGFLLVFIVLFYLIAIGLSIAMYVLQSVGFYTVAKRRGIHHPWLAWVPVGNLWLIGSISDQYQYVAKGKVCNRRKVLLGLSAASFAACFAVFIAAFIAGLGAGLDTAASGAVAGASFGIVILIYLAMIVIGIVQTVFLYIALYDVYQSCEPGNAMVYLILSILFNITMSFFVFFNRNKDLGMPPRRKTVLESPVVEAPVEESPVEAVSAEQTPAEEIQETVIE